METVQEQMEYGSHCIHGTNIGTPGGADLMCGLCEDGFTKWVERPVYRLFHAIVRTKDGSFLLPWQAYDKGYRRHIEFYDGETSADWLLRHMVDEFSWLPTDMEYRAEFEFRQVSDGYWSDV